MLSTTHVITYQNCGPLRCNISNYNQYCEISLFLLKNTHFNGYTVEFRKPFVVRSCLHSFSQRSSSTDKQWSNQARVGIFNWVDS